MSGMGSSGARPAGVLDRPPQARRIPWAALAAAVTAAATALEPATAAEAATALVQDFETPFAITPWPPDSPGRIEFSTQWRADGERSLQIGPGLMAAFDQLARRDWRGYSLLRLRVYNPTAETAEVGFELQDQHTAFHERHQDAFGAPPGETTVDLDISGDLWRGEENRPYRGLVKTPLDMGHITRLAFTNRGGGALFVDAVELVCQPRPELHGAHAFDFGPAGTPVPFPWTGVTEAQAFQARRGFGLLGAGQALSRSMSFPTTVLGDGLAWPAQGFRVDLAGGSYSGWVAFERGGFWEGEAAGYTRASLTCNGAAVHEHAFQTYGSDFYFQDTEITDLAQLADRLIWPAHAVSTFGFEAAAGANVFQLRVEDAVSSPLRVAGLVLAPDTEDGAAFLRFHEQQQRDALARTLTPQDRGRRELPRQPPERDLVAEPLPVGEMVYPTDWPTRPAGAAPGPIAAVTGQVVAVHLGVYGRLEQEVAVSAGPPRGPGDLGAPQVAYGRYLPMRPYGAGVCWLEVNHYRPEPRFTVGPGLARSLVVEYEVPADAPAGLYQAQIQLIGAGTLDVPVSIRVLSANLPEVPIPVGLFMNALPFGPETVGQERWWQMQQDLLRRQLHAGLNCLTGGPGLRYDVGTDSAGRVVIDGAAARGYLRLAQQLGGVRAVVPYGGFLPHLRDLAADPDSLARALERLETVEGLPPHYVYAFDEPVTAAELEPVLVWLEPAAAGGLRTIGYTSWHEEEPLWWRLVTATRAPAINDHSAAQLGKLRQLGREPWVYNNGAGRLGLGLELWRGVQLGAAGRLEWIGLFTQGFAFHNLDGREPSRACFLAHRRLGALATPMWLASREGLLDLRLRLALEALAPAGDPALSLWTTAGYRRDGADWPEERLQWVRQAMLERLGQLTGR